MSEEHGGDFARMDELTCIAVDFDSEIRRQPQGTAGRRGQLGRDLERVWNERETEARRLMAENGVQGTEIMHRTRSVISAHLDREAGQ